MKTESVDEKVQRIAVLLVDQLRRLEISVTYVERHCLHVRNSYFRLVQKGLVI